MGSRCVSGDGDVTDRSLAPRTSTSGSVRMHPDTAVRGLATRNQMITLDYTNVLAPAVSGGIAASDWQDAPQLFAKANAVFENRRAAGELGFLDLPADAALHAQST